MNKLSESSAKKLSTCDNRLIEIVHEVLKEIDITVLYGERSIGEQLELYTKGRDFIDGQWIIVDKKQIVTYCDGIKKKSKHNSSPSQAIDIAPYPIDWNDLKRFTSMAEIFKKVANKKGIAITWGGDFKSLKDYPHFELGTQGV